MKRILICPNAFKGSLDAKAVAGAIARGLRESALECTIVELPIADGGDGSLGVINQYLDAVEMRLGVNDPLGAPVHARYGWHESEKTGVVELAEASGLKLLSPVSLNPWQATTRGTGQLIRNLLEKGARRIYLTIGGSATIDGAMGILDALGVKFYHSSGLVPGPLPSDLDKIVRIDADDALFLLQGLELIVLCDVENPLLGAHGAAAVFGPQKGADEEGVLRLERGLANLAGVVAECTGRSVDDLKHGGAAGGVAAMLHGVLGARLVNGGEQILQWAGFDGALQQADIVITGEGKIDEQTAYGKGPGLVARKAKQAGKHVLGLCGMVSPDLRSYDHFDVVLPIANGPGSLADAFAHTAQNLERTACEVGKLLKG